MGKYWMNTVPSSPHVSGKVTASVTAEGLKLVSEFLSLQQKYEMKCRSAADIGRDTE